MDRKKIVELASEAWISEKEAEMLYEFDGYLSCTYIEDLERFVDLVRKEERKNISTLIAKMPGDTAASIAIYVREL